MKLPIKKLLVFFFRSTRIIRSTKVNFMWCVFHNAQWYWSDNLCKLVTDEWRGSLGVRNSESCWFTEEIGTYMRCWESPSDLPLVIEIFVSFNFYHSWKITRSFPRTYVRTYYSFAKSTNFTLKLVCYFLSAFVAWK